MLLLACAIRNGNTVVLAGTVEVTIVGNDFDVEALHRIALETKRHPDADQFVVHIMDWLTWLHLDGLAKATVIYDRRSHTLEYIDGGDHLVGDWANVSEEAIEKVANMHAEQSDLKRYGAKEVPFE
jgi:hypothetical protein